MDPVLNVVDLEVSYYTDAGRAKALDRVNLTLKRGREDRPGRRVGLRQEHMALAMMRMIKPPGRIEGGQVIVDGTELTSLSEKQMLKARLSKIAYIPQGAMNSLNPVTRVGAQLMDAIKAHEPQMSKSEMRERSYQALDSVELKSGVFKMYPHELSGGMKQRVCIAMGIAAQARRWSSADESTSALDVVVQRQVDRPDAR